MRRKLAYILVPSLLTLAWASYYFAWERYYVSPPPLRVDQLPPPAMVWPVQPGKPDSPEIAAAKLRLKKLQEELIAIENEAQRARLEEMRRAGATVMTPDGHGPFIDQQPIAVPATNREK